MKYFFAMVFLTISAAGLDLDDQTVNFDCFMRTRGDTAGEEVVFYWTGFGQWLPWMKMGQRPGYLVYHCSGSKLDLFHKNR